ncbi:hypothetical protein Bbelb_323410 [Branchiostoma belcheri]|nr:hypothetical protein Bbelb_323410 [Branchiostoma belcheri]
MATIVSQWQRLYTTRKPTERQPVKATCYKALVWTHLEYSATVWDPYTIKGIQAVEAVQRRAARVTLNDYRRTSSVSQMLNDLNGLFSLKGGGAPALQHFSK